MIHSSRDSLITKAKMPTKWCNLHALTVSRALAVIAVYMYCGISVSALIERKCFVNNPANLTHKEKLSSEQRVADSKNAMF